MRMRWLFMYLIQVAILFAIQFLPTRQERFVVGVAASALAMLALGYPYPRNKPEGGT
jgi:hypothetical protein